jgi:membrane-associated phospholipid phosphatase
VFERLNRREANTMQRVDARRPAAVDPGHAHPAGSRWRIVAGDRGRAGAASRPAAVRGAGRRAGRGAGQRERSRGEPRTAPQTPIAATLPARQALPDTPSSPSFPSAHAAAASAFLTAVTRRCHVAGLAVLPLAAAVAYSRLRTRAHWPTDVAAGAAQGVLVGKAVHRLLSSVG